ncbi:MAG: type I DNA topoisomerase [Alphaproteobacteria bacterium]|nr:type I DNA topoisomerase [Alphaproteobacteria bacterium]
MTAHNLVIVESPAKAKTIHKYLGADFEVIASYGHVRDLVGKEGSVQPDQDFAMTWALGDRAGKAVSDIKRAVKKADTIYLASDPDREGEAISWHIKEILTDANLLAGKHLRRVTFNEITKNAVKNAFDHARDLDGDLIDAYMARRALDYLVGFNISPVLWRKLPGSRSAGRVQSVALRLICERELEIEKFRAQEYWSIEALLHTKDGAPFTARLTTLAGNKLDKLDIGSADAAHQAATRIKSKSLRIQKIEKKQTRRNPYPPFITSSLQMEASRKLGYSAAQTMRLAQQLYESGLITYMRTDGTNLSMDAVLQARDVIQKDYGAKYLPDSPRLYKSKAKNAQEAHEAIRPTDLTRAQAGDDDGQRRLYDLIWKRTMASQMESAVMDQVAADISDGTDDVVLRATGSVVTFDGFLTLYHEDRDDDDGVDEQDRRLPPLSEQDPAKLMDVRENQHFTQPPPRYSEASLVKKLEELGIGRPSTYASILQVLRDRKYVTMESKRFIPEDRGRLVTSFLTSFFKKYVDYDFTANLEEELDAIASGHVAWKEALKQFWIDFSKSVEDAKKLTITNVIDHLNEELGIHFFPPKDDGSNPRQCPACTPGILSLKLGKFGAFIGCSAYPDCRFTRPLILSEEDAEGGEGDKGAALANEPKMLGTDPATGRSVSLRRGPYGPYVQIDTPADSKDKNDKPKRQGVPKGTPLDDVTLESALKLLALPRDVGTHPESGKMIQAGIGRFGPYLKHDGKFKSIPKDDDVLIIGMNRAVELLAQPTKPNWRTKKKEELAAKKAEEKAAKANAKKSAPKKKKTAVKKTTAKKK